MSTVLVTPRLASLQRIAERLREACLFVGAQKSRDRQLLAARHQKQPLDAEFLVRDLVELDPERIEHPFARASAMADLAHLQRGRRHRDLLVSRGVAVIEPERPVQQQHVEPEEAEHRPGAVEQEHHAGDEAHPAEQRHQHQEADAAERAVRREHGGKDRGFEVAVVGGHGRQYTETMAKKSARKSSVKTRKGKARQAFDRQVFDRQALDPCADRGSVPPLPGGEPGTQRRAQAHQSVHAAGGGGAVGAGDRCRRQQGDARAVRGRRHAGKDGRARRGARARDDQDHRLVPHQGQERGRAVAPAGRRAWRAGAARARSAGGAARRRAQDRERGAQYRVRRADHRGRHPYLPCRQPHRPGAWKKSVRGRAEIGSGDPGVTTNCTRITG